MSQITEEKKGIVYNKLAPYLPGLYSIQAVGSRSVPDVTIFRNDLKSAIKWMKSKVKRKEFTGYMLRHGIDRIDVYDHEANLVHRNMPIDEESAYTPEAHSTQPRVTKDELEYEGRSVLDENWSCLSYCECRADVSSASHSNFVVSIRSYMLEAGDDALEHLSLIDSSLRDYRTVGLFANVAKLPRKMQDAFLDSYQWLTNGWPMQEWHYKKTLAFRLCYVQRDTLADLIAQCFKIRGYDRAYYLSAKLQVTTLTDQARMDLATGVVELLAGVDGLDAIEFPDNFSCETFTHEGLVNHAEAITNQFTAISQRPIANK